MKKHLIITVCFYLFIIGSLIFLASCSDNAKYLSKHPEICELCKDSVTHKTDTVFIKEKLKPIITEPDTNGQQAFIDLLVFNDSLTCEEKIKAALLNQKPKTIEIPTIEKQIIYKTTNVTDHKLIKAIRADERFKCEKEFASKPKETDWFRWAFFVSCFIIILQFLARFLKR